MRRKFNTIEERLDFIEFRQELLFNNTDIDRLLFDYEITRDEYRKIMDLMDKYRTKIDNNEEVNHGAFEDSIYQIVPSHRSDYHMCEYIARDFANGRRWEEVFTVLYGDFPIYDGVDIDYFNKNIKELLTGFFFNSREKVSKMYAYTPP